MLAITDRVNIREEGLYSLRDRVVIINLREFYWRAAEAEITIFDRSIFVRMVKGNIPFSLCLF